MKNEDRLVYSTGPDGRVTCPNCRRAPCECPEGLAGASRPRTQTEPVRVSFRRTGKGSGVTLVEKLPMHPAGKEELLKKFKRRLGVGGTVKLGALEIQGEHRAFIKAELEAAGYRVKVLA
ncbi:MAG: translation initiation factor [Elusimicrobiota bacterium]